MVLAMQVAKELKKILIADPDTGVRYSMDLFLKESYSVFTASDGYEVLEILKNEKINMVIADSRIEGIYIFDLLRMIKEIAPEIPVIVMYVYLDVNQRVEEYIRKAADACLIKPFQIDKVIETIKNLLDSRKNC